MCFSRGMFLATSRILANFILPCYRHVAYFYYFILCCLYKFVFVIICSALFLSYFLFFIVYFVQEIFITHMMPYFFPFSSKSLFGLIFFVYVFFFLYLCHFYGACGHNCCFTNKDYIGTPQAGSFHSFPCL